jgi:hypothetical protein
MDPQINQSDMQELHLNGFFVYYYLNINSYDIFMNKLELIGWVLILFPSHVLIFNNVHCPDMQSLTRLLNKNPDLNMRIDYNRDLDGKIKPCRQKQCQSHFINFSTIYNMLNPSKLVGNEFEIYEKLNKLIMWINSDGMHGFGPNHSDFRDGTFLYQWTKKSREVWLMSILF